MVKQQWQGDNRRRSKKGIVALLALGCVIGIALWGALDFTIHHTNSLAFCVSCHDMEPVYQEYKKSVHYANPSGVRATCSDCHVPKDLGPKLLAKAMAANDVWQTIQGKINTPEKFEAHRLELAQRVWQRMEKTDSRECRSCHAFEAMVIGKQRENAQKSHPTAIKDGETCISCHKGIAHTLPDMSEGYKKLRQDLDAAAVALAKSVKPGTYFTLKSAGLVATSEGGDQMGTLLPATRIEVAEQKGNAVKITLTGWQQEGVDEIIYALPGKRIFLAALDKAGINARKKLASNTDADTGQVWSQVRLEAWMKPDGLVDSQEKLWNYAGEMYTASCSVCHKAPAANHLLANQWIGNLDAMKRFITLNKEEYRLVQKYLQLHAQDVDPSKENGSAAGSGASSSTKGGA